MKGKRPLPREVSVWKHHFINTKIGTLVTFFFVLLGFAMFSTQFMSKYIPKDFFVSFYALMMIVLCALYLKTVH
ncbi:MAG: hypothetical protein AABX01_08220 [Candidatus Micrarchaeota archaeon]